MRLWATNLRCFARASASAINWQLLFQKVVKYLRISISNIECIKTWFLLHRCITCKIIDWALKCVCFARRKSIKAHLWLNTHTHSIINIKLCVYFAWDMSTINLKWNRLCTPYAPTHIFVRAHTHTHSYLQLQFLFFFIAFAFVWLLIRSHITAYKSFIINASICDASEERKHTDAAICVCVQNAANRIRSKVKRPSDTRCIHLHTLIEIVAITMWACLGIN